MTIRWILFGDLDEPVGLLRFEKATAQWWNLELVDDQDERGERGYWSHNWLDDEEKPPARDGWQPSWVRASPSDVEKGDQVLHCGAQGAKPDSYMGARLSVTRSEIRADQVRTALRRLAVSESLADSIPAGPGRLSRIKRPQVPLQPGQGPTVGV